MNFKKPTKKGAANTASMLAGATVGAMVSDAVASIIPLDNPTYARLAVLGVGVLGMLTINGSGAVAEGAKGAFAGMAIHQGVKVSRENLVKVLPASATANSFVADALALSEVQVKQALAMPLQNRNKELYGMSSLGNPNFEQPRPVITPMSLLA
ncbi:hypothetical protein [Bizionia myxarmorum]|uniref:Uncharacterized protein n=1 Tax=Bizionia myxarmorum TaxID=291186 RepID=A0A5D0RC96_9FLAO|nr:hypothetical protein [Bizionia myxarmorum]TYB78328.1 hypothetical protein ES674_00680 [Bizionia myxarmorum]